MTYIHSRLVVSQSRNSGQSVKQARKQSSKQASAQSQSVSYLLISVFTVPPRAHPSAALQTPSTFTFKIAIILGKTHAQSRRAFVNNDFVHRESVESERRDTRDEERRDESKRAHTTAHGARFSDLPRHSHYYLLRGYPYMCMRSLWSVSKLLVRRGGRAR